MPKKKKIPDHLKKFIRKEIKLAVEEYFDNKIPNFEGDDN